MRYFFLGLLGCCMWLGAQNKTVIPVDLQWTGAERWSIGDSLSTEVIGLERAAYLGEHHLPYYQYTLPAGEADGCLVEVKNPALVPVAADELALLAGTDLPQTPTASVTLSGARGQWSHRVSVFPFVEQEGRAMKLQSFDLELTRTKQAGKATASIHAFASQSVLSQGRFVKVRVTESGLYKLTYADLRAKGIDPANVRLFGYGGGVLSEDFSRPWHDDLPEVAVYDTGNAILFYAQGVNKWTYDEAARKFTHEINPYSTYGYYFVTSDNVGTKKRITSREAMEDASVYPDVDVFTDYAVYERERATINNSGRKLYENINPGGSVTASFSFPNLCTDSLVQVRASAANGGNYSLRLNGGASQSISASGYTDRSYSASSGSLQFTLAYSGSGVGYLDYIEVNVKRDLAMSGAYMTFHNRENLGKSNRYRLNAGTSVRVWDINDPVNVTEIPLTDAGGRRTFVDDAATAKSYVAVDLNAVGSVPSATLLEEVPRQNLHGMASVDMLIITPSAFRSAAEALAQAHAELDGLAVGVVTADEVYNEFSSGTPDATAYRRMAKMLYGREDIPLRYLLLMGKGSYDNRGLLSGSGSNTLLTYQSVNSVASDKESYTTDDYFGYLDDHEGNSLGSGDLLDIAIGRIPVTTGEQAQAVVDKTIQYMRNETPGAWKNQLCFLGDDEDNNTHMEQANGVADLVASGHRAYYINKIMLDAYQQEVNASGQSYPLAKNQFNNLIRRGLLYINYMGHANVNGWTGEGILKTNEIPGWTNQYLPLVSAGTCEFSRYDREFVCGAEELLLNARGGAIGCFSATRSVYPAPNYSLMRSFAEHLFANADVPGATIGDAVMQAKNAVTTDAANKLSYVYFGDPAVRLNYPNPYRVAVQEVNGHPVAGTDTLRALSETTLRGVVLDEAGQKAAFNGTVQVVVLDKEETVTCFNNDNETTCDGCSDLITPFTYRDRSNTIFKGTAQVTDGDFSLTFKLPKDIKYNYGSGRMVFTAWDEAGREGGQGYFEQFTVGGSSDDAETVNQGPQVQMYLNYPGFVSGGQVNETPVFTARVYDEYGINVSSPTPGHDIMLMLDDNRSFVLNDYYESALGTYKEGTVSYQLPELDDGHYTLMFRVWNLYNVSTMQSLDFEVVRGLNPEILTVRCYPNPATTETTIQVTHNREGEIVEMTVDVYDLSGKRVWTQRQQATDRITWDLTAANGRLAPGMYLYRVSVQTDGDITSSRANKLIVR